MDRGFAEILLSKDYAVDAGTLAANTTNYEVNIGDIEKILQVLIINDGAKIIQIKFDNIANDNFPLKAGENLPLSKIDFRKIYLTNANALAQAYRVLVTGV